MIVADEKDIIRRRKRDRTTRPDRSLSIDLIKKEQTLELKTAFRQANELSVPIEIIKNKDGKKNEVVSEFIELIKKYRIIT